MNRHTMDITQDERELLLTYRQIQSEEYRDDIINFARIYAGKKPQRRQQPGRITVINTGKRVFWFALIGGYWLNAHLTNAARSTGKWNAITILIQIIWNSWTRNIAETTCASTTWNCFCTSESFGNLCTTGVIYSYNLGLANRWNRAKYQRNLENTAFFGNRTKIHNSVQLHTANRCWIVSNVSNNSRVHDAQEFLRKEGEKVKHTGGLPLRKGGRTWT